MSQKNINLAQIKKFYEENPMGEAGVETSEEEFEIRKSKIRQIIKVESPKKLLDIGCGKGFIGKELVNYVDEYIGLDISLTALKIAKTHILDGHLIVGNASNLPLKDQTVDAIVCSEVLEHIPEYEKSISEMSRVLKMGGLLVITTPNYYNFHVLLRLLIKGRNTRQVYDKPIPYKKLKSELKKHGFRIERLETFYPHFPLKRLLPYRLRILIEKTFFKIISYISFKIFGVSQDLYILIAARKI